MRKSFDLNTPLKNLAQLASGFSGPWEKWPDYQYLDASARRVADWRTAVELMVGRWSVRRAGRDFVFREAKESVSEWLRTKHKTLTQALKEGEILPIDVLDAVVRSPFAPCQAVLLIKLLQLEIDLRKLGQLYVSVFDALTSLYSLTHMSMTEN